MLDQRLSTLVSAYQSEHAYQRLLDQCACMVYDTPPVNTYQPLSTHLLIEHAYQRP